MYTAAGPKSIPQGTACADQSLRGHFVAMHALSLLGPPMRATFHRLCTNSAVPWKAPVCRSCVKAEASRKHGRKRASCNGSINHGKQHDQSKELASRRAYMSGLMHHAVSNRVQLNRSWRAPARQQYLNSLSSPEMLLDALNAPADLACRLADITFQIVALNTLNRTLRTNYESLYDVISYAEEQGKSMLWKNECWTI